MKTIIASFTILLSLAACADHDTISTKPDGIVLRVDSLDDLTEAKDRAQEYCSKLGKPSVLDHTEAVDDEVVAYFNCR